MRSKDPKTITGYRLHIGHRVTNKVLWCLITNQDDEPIANYPTVESAVHALSLRDIKTVEWQTGNYGGQMTINYRKPQTSGIMYHEATPRAQVQEVQHGENDGTGPIVRSVRLGRKVDGLQHLERHQVHEATRHPREPTDDGADDDPQPV